MEDASPPKWHLAHTTWFFETFILRDHYPGYKLFDEDFPFLFNSYYEHEGKRILRANRGLLTRPALEKVIDYRHYVGQHMEKLLEAGPMLSEKIQTLTELGLQHEQQHQELLFTDFKYTLGQNPLFPVYKEENSRSIARPDTLAFLDVAEGTYEIGFEGEGFCFDNERGRHKVFLHDFSIANRLVTNQEYIEFIEEKGYERFEFWLSEGWAWVNTTSSRAPLYWHNVDGTWYHFTLNGLKKVKPEEPVTHISFFEADAYARWKGMRLPTETEWEVACGLFGEKNEGSNFQDGDVLHPSVAAQNNQFFGDCWEWTNSAYLPYPYFEKAPGAVGEYNGKFMINQMVLRGGSCVTPEDHIRLTYRNFFPTYAQWQFSGIRLAKWN